jgi:hypothetical protein
MSNDSELRIVVFWWVDSDHTLGWTDVLEFEKPLRTVPASGILVNENSMSITIATSVCDDTGEAIGTLRVPKSAIVGKVETVWRMKRNLTVAK